MIIISNFCRGKKNSKKPQVERKCFPILTMYPNMLGLFFKNFKKYLSSCIYKRIQFLNLKTLLLQTKYTLVFKRITDSYAKHRMSGNKGLKRETE